MVVRTIRKHAYASQPAYHPTADDAPVKTKSAPFTSARLLPGAEASLAIIQKGIRKKSKKHHADSIGPPYGHLSSQSCNGMIHDKNKTASSKQIHKFLCIAVLRLSYFGKQDARYSNKVAFMIQTNNYHYSGELSAVAKSRLMMMNEKVSFKPRNSLGNPGQNSLGLCVKINIFMD